MLTFKSHRMAQLQKRVEALEAVVAAVDRSQAMIEFTLDGVILSANENFLAAMGYRLDEIRGQRHSLFVSDAYAQSQDYAAFWRRLAQGEFLAGKFQRLGKGSADIWIQGSYNPVFDAHGNVVKIVKFATDITALEQERATLETERQAVADEQTKVLGLLAQALGRLAQGDLTARFDAPVPDAYRQLQDDFNGASQSLSQAVGAAASASVNLRLGADEIAQASDDLSRRTEQQAASLEETAAALDQITATVRQSAAGAHQAAEFASQAKHGAANSAQIVRQTVDAMDAIERSSRQISQIIGVIDEIAFQTNLLALNAGVEAARAGEAGRGFAVVAQEVRALAQRSAEAAKEIKVLIATSSAQVEQGVDLVGRTGEALDAIVERVVEIDGLIGGIARASKEQATGLGQVNDAVNQMDQVTQQNAAMVEQATAAAANLRAETADLTKIMGGFSTGAKPDSRPAVIPPAPLGSAGVRVQRRPVAVSRFGSAHAQSDWEEF